MAVEPLPPWPARAVLAPRGGLTAALAEITRAVLAAPEGSQPAQEQPAAGPGVTGPASPAGPAGPAGPTGHAVRSRPLGALLSELAFLDE